MPCIHSKYEGVLNACHMVVIITLQILYPCELSACPIHSGMFTSIVSIFQEEGLAGFYV